MVTVDDYSVDYGTEVGKRCEWSVYHGSHYKWREGQRLGCEGGVSGLINQVCTVGYGVNIYRHLRH